MCEVPAVVVPVLFQYCCDIDALATTQRPQAAARPNFITQTVKQPILSI